MFYSQHLGILLSVSVSGQRLCCLIFCPNWSIFPFRTSLFLHFSVINVFSIVHHLNLCLFSAFNAHALGALAEVAGPGLNSHLGIVLPALLSAMVGDDKVCNKDWIFIFPLGLLNLSVNWHSCHVFLPWPFIIWSLLFPALIFNLIICFLLNL